MKNTGQELAFRHVVRPERGHFAIRGSHPAAEKRYSRSARPYARPGPAPHVKCPIAPRNALGIRDSQTRAGSSRVPDSDRSVDPIQMGKEFNAGNLAVFVGDKVKFDDDVKFVSCCVRLLPT